MRHYFAVLALFLGLVLVAFVAAGVLVQQDVSWYQSANPGDPGLPPAFAAVLFVCYPAYIAIGGTIYVYLRTRLPDLLASVRWNLLIATLAPFFFVPAFNPDLLDQHLTLSEGAYLTAYWAIMGGWLVLGVAPFTIRFCVLLAGEVIKGEGNLP